MSDNKSKKRGLFGWFGKKDDASQNNTEESVSPEELDEKLEQAEEALEEALESDLEQQLETEANHKETVSDHAEESNEHAQTRDTDSTQAKKPTDLEHSQHTEADNKDSIADSNAEPDKNTIDTDSTQAKKPTDLEQKAATEAQHSEVTDNDISAGPETVITSGDTQEKPARKGFFSRLKDGLSKTRSQLTSGIADLVLGSKQIDDDLLEDIETQLLMADVGVEATRRIIDDLTQKSERKELKDPQALMDRLRELLSDILRPCSEPLSIDNKPHVILMVGVNGVGKTTTIGKLAKKFQQEGKSVMLAAGDTFRAAAVEQLQVWGERNNIHVTAQHTGADSASVIFDALQSAQRKNIDILIADTAGRLHTKSNLMDELAKVKRVMHKLDPSSPHEVMLVVDAGTGQNALNQAEHFHKAINLTGVTITKLDGTAKGGIIFALADKLQLPIRFIGVGEGIDDLREFNANDFIEALFTTEETS
ncbi:signal recognition particle-docking protein FtsY [Kangiella sediminilitoris]|uniref:Signal recognition particle receptor FtsY n=1 Tax=Kangiella sediminilitoris TaxID=1144748 RepID=A0A1B3BE07_9GAMM|nr:signal recognition particle-docking protein FtsY [Kangiella sediminilitoris]AOE50965.1 cell division protein FtsY [Kangiella sediminilitoris]